MKKYSPEEVMEIAKGYHHIMVYWTTIQGLKLPGREKIPDRQEKIDAAWGLISELPKLIDEEIPTEMRLLLFCKEGGLSKMTIEALCIMHESNAKANRET